MLNAADIMQKKVVVIKPDEIIANAISTMIENKIHHLPVVNSNKLEGIIGFDTLLRRPVIPVTTKVSSIMEHGPRALENTSVVEISRLMIDSGRKVVAIVDTEDRLKGIITSTDLVKRIKEILDLNSISLSEIMSRDPITVNEDDDIDKAVKNMQELDEFSIPVTDSNGKLTGMLNIEDFSRAYWREKERMSQGEYYRNIGRLRVKDVMSPPVFSYEEDKIDHCISQMIKMGSRLCVVVDKNMMPIGILSHSDLLDEIIKLSPEEGVLVNISGVKFPDLETYDRIYEVIQRRLKGFSKINRLTPKILNIHVEEHKQQSGEIKYSVRGRLTTESRTFFARAWDWDIFKAVRDLMDEFKKMVEKEKEKRTGS